MPGVTSKALMDAAHMGAGTELLALGRITDETARTYWNAYHDWLEELGIDADGWMAEMAEPDWPLGGLRRLLDD